MYIFAELLGCFVWKGRVVEVWERHQEVMPGRLYVHE